MLTPTKKPPKIILDSLSTRKFPLRGSSYCQRSGDKEPPWRHLQKPVFECKKNWWAAPVAFKLPLPSERTSSPSSLVTPSHQKANVDELSRQLGLFLTFHPLLTLKPKYKSLIKGLGGVCL